MKEPIKFLSPTALYTQTTQEMDTLGLKVMYAAGGNYQKLKEAWCASLLGLAYEQSVLPCQLHVTENQNDHGTDFILNAGGTSYPFQVVEVMEPDWEKRRGQFYKATDKGNGITCETYLPDLPEEMGPQWVQEKIALKAKRYGKSSGVHLAIYANFSSSGFNKTNYIDTTKYYKSHFTSIWVITNKFVTTLHSIGDLGSVTELFDHILPERNFARPEL